MKRLLVIGGGLSGLSAAWHAQRAGAQVRLLEVSDHAGGVVQTIRENGYLVETGPNTMVQSNPNVGELLKNLNLDPEVIPTSAEAKRRFIVRNDKMLPAPMSAWQFATTPLLSIIGKLRLLQEPWAEKRMPDEDVEESLAEFARRRLGSEALSYGLEPFAAGIFAGDAEKLALRHAFPRLHAMEKEYGSLFQAMRAVRRKSGGMRVPRTFSFREGMATLPRALAAALGQAIVLQAKLTALNRTNHGEWEAAWETPAGQARDTFDGLVLATPAHGLAHLPLLKKLSDQLAPLSKIEHPPVTVVALGYPREAVSHPLDGFGVLVPATESFAVLGVLFTSSLFPQRAPDGHVLLTAFIGGSRWPEMAALPEAALLPLVESDLEKLVGASGTPIFQRIIRWPRAIPQYNLDYGKMLAVIDHIQRDWPSLALAGSYLGGVSVANCLETGRLAALRALKLSPNADD